MPEIDQHRPPEAHFLTAPALEALFALNALAHPGSHAGTAEWAAGVEARLTPQEAEALALLRRLPESLALGDLAVQRRCFQNPEELASLVEGLPPDPFARLFLDDGLTEEQVAALRADPQGPERLRRDRPWVLGGHEEALAAVLHRTEALQAAHALLLRKVWSDGVAPMLPTLEPLWQATLEQAREEAAGKDPAAFAIEVFGKRFGRRYGPDYTFPVYLFAPSYFISPLRVALFEREMAVLTLDCRLGPWALTKARTRLLEGLKALAEENRLEILRLLSHQKGFGGWIAGRLKLKPATVTHHIAALRKAGLLVEEAGPPGAAKYFRTDREAVRRLIRLLEAYVENRLEPDWEEAAGDGDGDPGRERDS